MMKPLSFKIFLFISTLEGILALIFLFWIPSMGKNAAFLGFSFSRLLIGFATVIPAIFILAMTIRSIYDRAWVQTHLARIDLYFQGNDRLLVFTSTPIIFLAISSGILYLLSSPASKDLGMLPNAFERMWSFYFWVMAVSMQWVVLMLVSYPKIYWRKSFIQVNILFAEILVILMGFLTVFNWSIPYFRLQIFAGNRYWPWEFSNKPFTSRDLIFVVILGVSMVCVWIISNNRATLTRGLILLIFSGFLIQVGFAYMDGQGFESIRNRYINSGHKDYAILASESPPLLVSIRNYEELYGKNIFLSTKPPGVIFFYTLAGKFTDLFFNATHVEDKFLQLTTLMAYVIPFLSMLVLIPLTWFSQNLWGEGNALHPSALFIVLPPVILFYLELDQFFHPILLMGAFVLFLLTLRTHSLGWAFLTGVYLYLALFFSFTMIFLPVVLFFWGCLDYYQHIKLKPIKDYLYSGMALILGFAIMGLVFYLFLSYNPLVRYQNSITSHKYLKDFAVGLKQILDAIVLNNGEFIHWAGIPIALLFFSRCVRSISAFAHKKSHELDSFSLAFALAFLLLNIFGQTRGEVARLWIFLLPPLSLFCAVELRSLLGKYSNAGIYLVICMQLLTTLMMFKYQDPFIPF